MYNFPNPREHRPLQAGSYTFTDPKHTVGVGNRGCVGGACQRTAGAWLAIAIAAVLGAMRLPPNNTIYIDSSYRLGYGLVLVLCLLITLYHPPHSSVPLERTNRREENRQKPYSENDLPTLAPHTRGAVEKQTCEVAGLDIYKWERACAHLSDVVADARIKLQENDQEQLYYLYKARASTGKRYPQAHSTVRHFCKYSNRE